MGVVKYNSDWIDRLHHSEATIVEPEPKEPEPDYCEVWDCPPYRDSIGDYWHERMAEKYGPFMWAVGT